MIRTMVTSLNLLLMLILLSFIFACGSAKSGKSSATDENHSGTAPVTTATGGSVTYNNEAFLAAMV